MVELLRTKLFIPRPRTNLVPRPRLVERLNTGLEKKLTLVSAPAGFGKTTLVVAWIRQNDLPAAWLSLDEADNDLPRFLVYLIAALQQVDEEIGASLLNALQSPQLPPIESVLTALLNEVALREDPLILVMDDFHLLTNTEIFEVLGFLIQHQPPQLSLVLTTREDPDLPLARLRARDQLAEIRAWDLRFTQAETDAFMRGVMGLELTDQDVAVLEDITEGWAVGLQLAGLSMQRQADKKSFIADFSGSHRHILDYLTDEVLQQQPERVRTFLLQTAVLDRLSAPLCNAVTNRLDSEVMLAYLENANLFVIPLDDERRWYRYHHLFSDLLRSQLTRSQPELIPELHRRASCWYEENGDVQAAIDHALQEDNFLHAAHLIDQHAIPKLYQGEVTTVVGWFERLQDEIVKVAPMMCIAKAWALALSHRTHGGEVERELSAAEHGLDLINASETLRTLVAGHTASIRAFVLQTQALRDGSPEKLIALSQEAQRYLPEDEKAIRSVNALNIGYSYLALSNLEAARTAYQQTLEDGVAGGNLYAGIYGPLGLIVCAFLEGKLGEGLQLCETFIEQFNNILAGQSFPLIGTLYILKGKLLLEMDHLLEAEQALSEGLALVHWIRDRDAHARGCPAMARLRAIQGNRVAMLGAISTLEDIWPKGAFYAQSFRHSLLMRYWPDDPDVRSGASAWLTQSGFRFEALKVISGVDPIHEAYFESYLNAAYVIAHLANEKPDAYPTEDVQLYLARQQDHAEDHGVVCWVVAIAITRTLLYQATGERHEALDTLATALTAAAQTGLFRIFVDEHGLQSLIEEVRPRLEDASVVAYANRLLDAFNTGVEVPEPGDKHAALLSERELDVLRSLAQGLTYQEIGQQLFLSLNTVQFHVKNIYSKLLVNKRVQAVEKARELRLI